VTDRYSLTSHAGTVWAPSPWEAAQRAAADTLRRLEAGEAALLHAGSKAIYAGDAADGHPRFCTYWQLSLGLHILVYRRDGEINKRVNIDTEKIGKLLCPQKDFRAYP
jgi:hypothetical protein